MVSRPSPRAATDGPTLAGHDVAVEGRHEDEPSFIARLPIRA